MYDYYALLGVVSNASNMEIITAYRQAQLTYKTDSIATYSLFDDEELDQIRTQIEQAYQTLSNPERRRVYNHEMGFGQTDSQESPQNQGSGEATQHCNIVDLAEKAQAPAGIRYRMATATVFPGSLLKEIREFKGVELSDIADHTKISKRYLQAIEEEDISRLPELIYLKGYLKQYAIEIGLNPDLVVNNYPPLHREATNND